MEKNKLFAGLVELLRGDGSVIINKSLARKIGLETALVYSELVSKYKYWMNKDQLTDDGFFYCTVEDLENETTLSKHIQSKAITKLVTLGLIEYNPKRKVCTQDGNTIRHFKIVEDTSLILSLLSDNVEVKANKVLETIENTSKLKISTCGSKQNELAEVKNFNTNNTNYINTNSTNTDKEQESVAATYAKNEISEITSFFKDCFNNAPTKQIILAIAEYKNRFNLDCIYEAMKRAGAAGKDWSYALGIIKSWDSKGLHTLEAIERGDIKKIVAAKQSDEPLNHKNKFAKAMTNHNFNHDNLDRLAADEAARYTAGEKKQGVVDWSKAPLIRGGLFE